MAHRLTDNQVGRVTKTGDSIPVQECFKYLIDSGLSLQKFFNKQNNTRHELKVYETLKLSDIESNGSEFFKHVHTEEGPNTTTVL